MKVVLDMNLSPKGTLTLGDAGYPSRHWSTLGPGGAPDSDIASYAATNGSIVLTNDLDFGKILAESNAAKPSVIQLRVADARPTIIGHLVLEALERHKDDLGQGALITIEDRRTRIRALPFRKFS
jgi:predicted nuclease of predicted toxin-antitoxin system